VIVNFRNGTVRLFASRTVATIATPLEGRHVLEFDRHWRPLEDVTATRAA